MFFLPPIKTETTQSPAHRTGITTVFPCCGCCGGESSYEVLELDTDNPLWQNSES